MGHPINPTPDPIRRDLGNNINRTLKHSHNLAQGGRMVERPAVIQDTVVPYQPILLKEDASGTNFPVTFPLTLTYESTKAQNLFLYFIAGPVRGGTVTTKFLIFFKASAASVENLGANDDTVFIIKPYWIKSDFDPSTVTWATRPATPFSAPTYEEVGGGAHNSLVIQAIPIATGEVADVVITADADTGLALFFGLSASTSNTFGLAFTLQSSFLDVLSSLTIDSITLNVVYA